jgi:hypothetical protein
MSNSRFSIKTLLRRMTSPSIRKQCLYFVSVSQLIRSQTEKGESYTDTHFECTKLLQRITKKHCINCQLFKPIISDNGEK